MPEPLVLPAGPVHPPRIGCSGWLYRHWRGAFYPAGLPVKRWFAHYADVFDTVEINNSFYRLPAAETFAAWRKQAPPGFRYAVKANRYLTQAKKLKDCAEPLTEMLQRVRQLGPTLGPVLVQLPPRFKANAGRLESFLALLPADLAFVFEFREPSWYAAEIIDLLQAHGAGLVVHDMPGLASPRIATGRIAYVRLHGGEGKYWGRYSDEALSDTAAWMKVQRAEGREVWAFFNNDINAAAIEDARTLRAMVASALPAPAAAMEDA